eukprot:CAMPEP_0197180428 /NCGR_PEP_ID=MMETSP1423-20130617/5051_1 /TAXON_ID=476441 /ORGANISM="Pseudo-nitzschia heimii, Strain UNC1101" /LENGTH=37 /DNA_ID= /DNA_START= /DNA_END= /DNA_ORIENTATION=
MTDTEMDPSLQDLVFSVIGMERICKELESLCLQNEEN